MTTSPPVKKALAGLLRDPANNTCADCKAASHPRWASWSLGVFICIRCAGLHRSLGTHISKVKSVDLDAWKEEELVNLVKMCNNRIANDYYEAKLPESMRKPITDANQLQSFVKNKYEKKKWISTGEQPNGKSEAAEDIKPQLSSTESLLADFEEVQPKLQKTSSSTSSVTSTSTSSMLNLRLSSMAKNRTDQQNNRDSNRPDLKKSILSLYSKPKDNNVTKNSFYQSSNSTGASLPISNSIGTTNGSNNSNANKTENNLSISSLDENELFKNVWT